MQSITKLRLPDQGSKNGKSKCHKGKLLFQSIVGKQTLATKDFNTLPSWQKVISGFQDKVILKVSL